MLIKRQRTGSGRLFQSTCAFTIKYVKAVRQSVYSIANEAKFYNIPY